MSTADLTSDVGHLIGDLANHTPDERAHILAGCFEKGAATILKTGAVLSGDPTMDALANKLNSKADTDLAQGNLNFQDYADIYKFVNDL